MTRTLLWDAGPGEIRAGLVEDGTLTEFRIIRQRRHEALLKVGECYTARILKNLEAGKALVSLGGGVEALLEQAPLRPEGTLLAVEMTRSPIPEPGRWKRAIVKSRPDIVSEWGEGWHFSREPWETYLHSIRPEIDLIICPNVRVVGDLVRAIGLDGPMVRSELESIIDAEFDSLIETAAVGQFPIKGGMLSIERTRAMTMIDIDGDGDPLALNLVAAREVPRLLRLLDIGGQIGIDFLAVPDRKSRLAIDAALADACIDLGQHERTAVNGFGFAQIVRPRRGPSIPEILCGVTPGRLSVESRAIALLRDAARSVGQGKRQIVAPLPIIDMIRQWPEETGALQSSLGVEIELVPDPSVNGYGHVHVSQS